MSGWESNGQLPAPGWYPDPQGVTRWWDGGAWTATTYAQPVLAPAQVRPGTRSSTVWAWLIAVLPLLGVVPVILAMQSMQDSFTRIFEQAASDPTDSRGMLTAQLAMYGNPWVPAASMGSWVLAGLFVLFGFFDWRVLRARGFDRPFHWAWGFLGSLVYLIGRAVVVRRRGASALAPMWVAIVVQVGIFVAAMVAYSLLLVAIMQQVASLSGATT